MNKMEQNHPPVRLALVGAGIFARDAHAPSLLRLQDRFQVVAVFSRTAEAASALASQFPGAVAVFTDLDALLAAEDVEAFDVMLPINVMPGVVTRLLASGKHLISEKPVAVRVDEGRRLLEKYAPQSGQIWMVGENWRYEAAFRRASELVKAGAIGAPITCHWAVHAPITPSNKYFASAWRRAGDFPGGPLLDGGVHHVAVLRDVVGEIAEVSALLAQIDPTLPPADTLSATLRFENGAIGAYIVSYASAAFWPQQLHVVGSAGSLRVQRRELEVHRNGETEVIKTTGFDGVEVELAAFADAIRSGARHLNTPAAALQDVAVIEAMLAAADTGQTVRPARVI